MRCTNTPTFVMTWSQCCNHARCQAAAPPMRGFKRQREWTPPRHRGESKGKGDRKEKAKAKAKEKKRLSENWKKSWFSEKTAPDGQTKPTCIRYNLSQCTSQKCTFAHCCPVFNVRLHRPQSDCVSSQITLSQLPTSETATDIGVKSCYGPDDSIAPAIGSDATVVSNRGTSSRQVLFRYLCRPQCTFVSRGHQSWARSPDLLT